MNELALFAGVGGGLLASRLLGWTTVGAVEKDPYCRRVLLSRMRDGFLDPFPVWDDVTTFDGKPWKGTVDVVSGGFPCQDISVANQRGLGVRAGKRSGLWREFARIIGEVGLDLLLSKTPRCFAPEDWMPSSPMFQQWGMMLSGVCWELGMSGLPTRGTESSFWPTPTTMDTLPARPLKSLIEQNRKEGRENRKAFKNLREAVVHAAKLPRMVPTIIASDYKTASRPGQRKGSINDPAMGVIPAGGTLNPDWAEWLMGFPVGWTALKELETHRFLRWLQLHSEFCQRG